MEEYKQGGGSPQNRGSPGRGLKIRPANQNYDLLNVQKHPGLYT